MYKRIHSALVALALIGLVPNVAYGIGCTVSASTLAFGNYDALSATPLDMTGSVTFSCLAGIAVGIGFSKGSSTSYTPRTMTGPVTASYNIYLDSGHTQIWGDTTGGTFIYSNLLTVGATVPFYGRVPALQNLKAGSYADTVVMTITF